MTPRWIPALLLVLLACSQTKSVSSPTRTTPVTTTPDSSNPASGNERAALERINQARAIGRNCKDAKQDDGWFAPAKALTWNSKLAQAALGHSQDMLARKYFAHEHPQGPSFKLRLERVDYAWMAIGENIAAGQKTLEDVVVGWLNSAGHCANIMAADFTQMGLAKVDGSEESPYRTYWTLDFAKPK